jgi:hypothetical protein
MARVTFSFTLDSEKDRRIIRYLNDLPHGGKGEAIREALEAHVVGAGVSLADVYQVVKEIDRKLARGVVVAGGAEPSRGLPGDVIQDADILERLDNLGL